MTPAQANIQRWRENPAAFAHEVLKFEPDPWQLEFFKVFPSQDPDKMRISLQACTGPGKTAVLAVANLNFISCYGAEHRHPRGLCTSITGANLNANLWPELSVWQQRSEYLKRKFQWTATRFFAKDHPETWFIEARTWQKQANAEQQGRTFSGLHAPYMLVTLDESGDMPVPVLRSGEQIFSSTYEWAKVLQSGNPTSHSGALYHAASVARHLWCVIRVTGDPDDPRRSPRINLENAKAQIAMYGRDNPWIKATILGEFPPSAINALLGVEEVEAAMHREHLREDEYDWSQKRLGVDVARFGDDRTVIAARQGLLVPCKPVIMRNARTTDIAARVATAIERYSPEMVIVDDTGHWGHGVIDNLLAARHHAIGIQYHGPAIDPRYKNRRCEMWMKGAEWVKAGGSLPYIPELIPELTEPTYTFVAGKFFVEPKDLVKKRLGRSPDIADAIMNTFAFPDMPKGAATKAAAHSAKQRLESDWDPYQDREAERLKADHDPFKEMM